MYPIEGETENLEKELFEMVYDWGKVRILVDENTPAFTELLDKIKKCAEKKINK